MHTRRLITFLVGAWLGGMALVGVIATENFRTSDRIVDMPLGGAKKVLDKIGRDSRALVRHEASEMNRAMFETSEWAQIALGASIIALVIFSRRQSKERVLATLVIAGLMLTIVLIQRFLLTPEMMGTGRLLDFGEAANVERERRIFGSLHIMYGAAEIVKGLIGLFYVGFLLKASGRPAGSSRKSRQIDTIDDTDYSHVDG